MVLWRGEMFRRRATRPDKLGDPTWGSLAYDAGELVLYATSTIVFLIGLTILIGGVVI